MADRMTTPSLISRLEEATEGSRELDYDIQCQIDPIVNAVAKARGGSGPDLYGATSTTRRYTTSLDAALSLVPEGWSISLNMYPVETDGPLWTRVFLNNTGVTARHEIDATAPALALCIAALKARETS